jgi:predicted amidohydrolase
VPTASLSFWVLPTAGDIYNAAAILHNKQLADVYHKHYLPNYAFSMRTGTSVGAQAPVYKLGDVVFGVNICEDIWYPGDPTRRQSILGGAHNYQYFISVLFVEGEAARADARYGAKDY